MLNNRLINKIIIFMSSFFIKLASLWISMHAKRRSKTKKHNYSHLFCIRPWMFLAIGEADSYHVCCSPWMHLTPGSISRDPIEIWNNKTLQKIRKSILDGSFRYCNEQCPYLHQPGNDTPVRFTSEIISDPKFTDIIIRKKLTTDKLPHTIYLCNDISCQLSCPQCRPITIINKKVNTRELEIASQLLPTAIRLNLAGTGDPLASPSYRNFLQTKKSSDYPNLNIYMTTNGLLLKKYWHTLGLKDSFSTIQVSVDAAAKETYEIIRRGGRWETLQENLTFLADLKKTNALSQVHLSFVVQKKNWREMPAFIEMARRFGFDLVIFSPIITGPFNYKSNILRTKHPEHNKFVESLKNPIFRSKNPKIILGDLLQFMPKHVE